MQSNSIDERTAVRQCLAKFELQNCFGVSLTLKQFEGGVKFDEIRASKTFFAS